jgi:hypothetical protein
MVEGTNTERLNWLLEDVMKGCEGVLPGRILQAFQRDLLPPSSTLKMEAGFPSETLVTIYQTIPHHIPEECNLHCHCKFSSLLTSCSLLA